MLNSVPQDLLVGSWVAAAITGAVAHVTCNPRSRILGPVISHGSRLQPRVALTFDDGPLPGSTDRILDILAELRVKAAFFVIGANVDRYSDLARRIHEEGHLVENHSYDHLGLGFLKGFQFWSEQLDRTDAAVERAIGLTPLLFRPPLGIRTWPILRAAKRYTIVTWSRRGYDGVATTSQRILARLVPHARPGEIMTLHDGVSRQTRRDPTATVEAVRPLILSLRKRGLDFARLDELTGLNPYLVVP
ncbi:MAG TPA: polysaccharide deacetylase family protein [Tepidisphaeraceae bacterium]|nr:polysaccharide deacetylase family protein [Tepidisphaeraceae bacterium]